MGVASRAAGTKAEAGASVAVVAVATVAAMVLGAGLADHVLDMGAGATAGVA
jgi:hypothetical protein